ncbi:MAG: cytochrome-c peroxidase [Nitrospira sp.]|nr:cytochrome-c peroxidase [Nitrospira sp.]
MRKTRMRWVAGVAAGSWSERSVWRPRGHGRAVGSSIGISAVRRRSVGTRGPGGLHSGGQSEAAKIELGRVLFFDKRLSKTNIACANCHARPGVYRRTGRVDGDQSAARRSKCATAINRVYSKAQFWDGRAQTLEEQSTGPFINPVEHGFLDYDEMIAKMKTIWRFWLFDEVFHGEITEQNIGKAIASFQRTLISGNSPADRVRLRRREGKPLTDSAKRGLELFRGRGALYALPLGV